MSRTVSFFYNQNEYLGDTVYLNLPPNDKKREVYIHTTSPIPAHENLDWITQDPTTEKDRQILLKELRKLIDKYDGGIVVHVVKAKNKTELDVLVSKVESPPAKCLALKPGYPAELVELKSKHTWAQGGVYRLALPKGGHLVAPTSRDAQEQLSGLIRHLAWVSRDVESLVLNTLWRPGVSSRLDRLEATVGIPESEKTMATRPSKFAWLRNLFTGLQRQAVNVTLVVLALIALNNLWLNNEISNLEQEVATLSEKISIPPVPKTGNGETGNGETGNGETGNGETGNGDGEDNPSAAAKRLAQLLVTTHSKDSALGELWDTHFSTIPDIENVERWSADDILALYQENKFVWGVIKLWVWGTGEPISDSAFLDSDEAWSGTKIAIRAVLKVEKDDAVLGNLEENDQKMLGVMACGIQYLYSDSDGNVKNANPDYREPAILSTQQGDNKELRFVEGSCDNLDEEDAVPGLSSIADELERLIPGNG